ncbi:RYR1 [Symbiodinium natans]|uniref:RYR1 protein n=1 Tax=Symbiodinium natans TaxID=878477 RepID=A0A812UBX4_9DINO|nr:RYR1 [Symbiodinium natans]
MAFNALTKFAPPELRTKLAGPLRVAAFGGGPAAELFAAVVARDLAGGTRARLAVYEWVETWRPIVDMVSDLIGEDIEYHQCDVSKSLFDGVNGHLQPADLQYDLLIFSHVLLECGRGDGEAPLQFLRDLWACCDGTVLVLDAGQARGRGCRSRPLAGSLRQVQILAGEVEAELVRINGASRTATRCDMQMFTELRASNELIADPAQVISSADTSKLQQFGQAADPQFEVGVSEEDDEAEADDQETDEKIIRPKREKACLTYTLEEQYEAYSKVEWGAAKTKIFDRFLEKVQRMLGEKYLHFLFGQARGRRSRSYVDPDFNACISWYRRQEECLVNVKRTSPEAQIDDFADLVNGEYISFVQKQYDLLGKPWPFNRAGEVIAVCINSTMLTTAIINSILVFVYTSSYSEHSILEQDIHYPNQLSVYILTFFAGLHFSLSLLWLGFYVLSYSGWIIETKAGKVDKWRDENPQLQSQLPHAEQLRISATQAKFFCSDGQLLYTLFLLAFSFLGLFVSFLFNAVNTIDLCMRIPILAKVIESMTQSVEQVAGTMVLGFCIQYIAVGAGFLLFSQGYGFADKDPVAHQISGVMLR